ncbi:MAG: methyltransferase domain-containing protein [Patescibacteria group bacterium]
MKKLNLGSGQDYQEGYVNVDNNPNYKADIIHDLNIFPYPFPDGEFTTIQAIHIIEHLDNPLRFLQELHRLAKDGAEIIIKCPHFSYNWFHPLHKSAISTRLFDFLDHHNSEYYGDVNFEIKKITLKWLGRTDLGKRKNLLIRFFNSIIGFLANLNLSFTERIWCYWVGGFEEIVFEVRAKK